MTSSSAARVQALLAEDPRLCAHRVVDGADGLQVTATVDTAWLAEKKQLSREAARKRMLRQWRFVYDRSYQWDGLARPPNFDVWVSAFTNQPIPLPQMQAWLDACVSQMRAAPHGRVLDIGCGVGLVLAALAPGGVSYEGLDLSEEAIISLQAWVATQEKLGHVRLLQMAAHELRERRGGPIDLAVLNSVAQYFPEYDYLTEVIQAVAPQIALGGSIFIGDLRAPALLPMRALNLVAAQAHPDATARQILASARTLLAETRELAIDPGYFQPLTAHFGRPVRVQFELKPSTIDRDLAGYRYDAMLRFDEFETSPPSVIKARSLEAIVQILVAERPPTALLRALPNARLAADAALARRLCAAAANTPLADLLNLEAASGIEPEAIAQAVAVQGYAAQARFTPGAKAGDFDVLLARDGEMASWPADQTQAAFANDPLEATLIEQLQQELQIALEDATGDGLGEIVLVAEGSANPAL